MEYKLNKIEPDLIRQVNAKTREGKIHKKEEISKSIVTSNENQGKNDGKANQNDSNGSRLKKRLLVEAKKTQTIEISVFHNDIKKGEVSKGIFLDVKK